MRWASAAVFACWFASAPARAREPILWTAAPHQIKSATGLAELAERARAAVVHVRGELAEPSSGGGAAADSGRASIGAGVSINKDGYILTHQHGVCGVVDLLVGPVR